ncbi:hypothetical protein HK102_006350 [Quaeritorhiza haematococci]|nr:hypothetical protein HK102_006350 [Quaeritorhiza haematococci]
MADLPTVHDAHSGKKSKPTIGVSSAIFLVSGGIIGAGIFATPSAVLSEVGSVGAAMVLWVVGGIASMMGALSYVEWGQMFPGKAGGDQVYLLHGYPRPRALVGFLFCWTGIFLIRPGYCAAISTVSAKYFLYGIFGSKSDPSFATSQPFLNDHWELVNKGTALLVVTIIHLTNALSIKAAIRMNDLLSSIKITVLFTFCVAGVLVMTGAIKHVETTSNFQNLFAGTNTNPGAYASALFAIFYVYDGWNYLNYSAGDLIDPPRTLPRGSIGGVLLCTTLYCLVNIAFLAVIPYKEFVTSKELVGGIFALKVFGETMGKKVVPILIAFSAYGACTSVTFGSARILQTAASQGMLPYPIFFKRNHPRLATPTNALLLNWFIAALLICVPPGERAFGFLVALATYPAWIFYGISLLGLILFRRYRPDWPRPFRVPVIAPLFVIAVAGFLAIFPFFGTDWLSSLVGLLAMSVGVPMYFMIRRRFTLDDLEEFEREEGQVQGVEGGKDDGEGMEVVVSEMEEKKGGASFK